MNHPKYIHKTPKKTNFLLVLIKNPKEMKKVQEEVRNAVGDKGKVDEDDLSKLTYMKAVVKEVLRLYPAAPLLIPRETTEDTIIHGYKIKKKTIVYVNALAIGRDPGSWRILRNSHQRDGTKKEDIDLEVMPGLTMTNKEDLCLLAQVYSGKATT
ncbi:putative 4-hydroxyphenylacetaldehyde oxime monooxygenase [Helianthus annuus]|nr:putative 4-hydroxyphenylacetaldehyde oxime monooxygenase [Helianthus annuus]